MNFNSARNFSFHRLKIIKLFAWTDSKIETTQCICLKFDRRVSKGNTCFILPPPSPRFDLSSCSPAGFYNSSYYVWKFSFDMETLVYKSSKTNRKQRRHKKIIDTFNYISKGDLRSSNPRPFILMFV